MASPDFSMPLEEAIRTQRALRRLRPDPVPDALVLELVELALKAPTGSNAQNWEFVVVRDPAVKAALARQNRRAFGLYGALGRRVSANDPKMLRVIDAVQWQADHLHEAPVIVVACLRGFRFPFWNLAATSFYGSIFPSVQNLLLGARAVGLGAALITLPLWSTFVARRILGLPVERDSVRGDSARLAQRPLRTDDAPAGRRRGLARSFRQPPVDRARRRGRRAARADSARPRASRGSRSALPSASSRIPCASGVASSERDALALAQDQQRLRERFRARAVARQHRGDPLALERRAAARVDHVAVAAAVDLRELAEAARDRERLVAELDGAARLRRRRRASASPQPSASGGAPSAATLLSPNESSARVTPAARRSSTSRSSVQPFAMPAEVERRAGDAKLDRARRESARATSRPMRARASASAAALGRCPARPASRQSATSGPTRRVEAPAASGPRARASPSARPRAARSRPAPGPSRRTGSRARARSRDRTSRSSARARRRARTRSRAGARRSRDPARRAGSRAPCPSVLPVGDELARTAPARAGRRARPRAASAAARAPQSSPLR